MCFGNVGVVEGLVPVRRLAILSIHREFASRGTDGFLGQGSISVCRPLNEERLRLTRGRHEQERRGTLVGFIRRRQSIKHLKRHGWWTLSHLFTIETKTNVRCRSSFEAPDGFNGKPSVLRGFSQNLSAPLFFVVSCGLS
jgi:hypothetical protein